MKTLLSATAAIVCLVSLKPLAAADHLETIPADEAQKYAARLVEAASKLEQTQLTVQGDPKLANGMHVPDKAGIMIVPQKDLQESRELADRFQQDPGAALGYLFLYHVVPVAHGKPVEAARLHKISMKTDDGEERSIYALLLSIRQLSESDYRLYGYGLGNEPIIDAKFTAGAAAGEQPAVIQVKDVSEEKQEATVVVTVFGRYAAEFPAAPETAKE